MARARYKLVLLIAVVTSLLLALWSPAVASPDPAGRGVQLDAWMNDPGLSDALRQRAAQVQSMREAHNSRASAMDQRFQDLRRRWESQRQRCSGRLSASQRSSCESAFARLKSEGDGLQSQAGGLTSSYNAVISAYTDLQRDVQTYEAAQRGADQASWHGAWSRGREDAIGCYPDNGHGYCSGAGGDYASCREGYAAGFHDGSGVRDQTLQRAYQLGYADGAAGRENASFRHAEAQGSCRTQWVQHYDQGHFEGRGG